MSALICNIVVSVVILACSVANADGLSVEEARQVERLIEALASRNPVPKEGGRKGDLIYPPEYDREAEKIPYRVAKQLTAFGPKAFPLLMQHSQDTTFSCVRESPSGAMRVISVGTVCEQIVAVQLNVFDTAGVYPRSVPDYFETEVRGEKFAEWWNKHQHQTLREIQVEAFEWAIAEQQKLIEKWKPRAAAKEDTPQGQPYEKLLSNTEKSLSKNMTYLKRLQKSDEPLAPGTPITKNNP